MQETKQIQAKMLFEDENTAIIGLYGVVFEGCDLDGEHFSKSTDFKLTRAVGAPVHIDHTTDSAVEMNGKTYLIKGIKGEVGEIVEVSPDDFGLYMKLQFEKSNSYWDVVEAMLNTGRMGASTGSDHRSQKSANGLVEIWPINEVSLTLTPAEPRTTQNVTRLKEYRQLLKGQGYTPGLVDALVKQAEDLASFYIAPAGESDDVSFEIYGTGSPITVNAQTGEIKQSELTDSEQSAEDEPKAQDSAVNQSDTSETDIEEIEAEIEAEELEPVDAPEVLDMTTENEVFDTEGALKTLLAGQSEMKSVIDSQKERIDALENEPSSEIKAEPVDAIENAKGVRISSTGLGDTEVKAMASWFKTGDGGTVNAAKGWRLMGNKLEIKASNDTTGNITTAADGGSAVPVGHFNSIIARRDELMLASMLGVREIPGTGTTVNVPIDNEDDGEFVATAEQNDANSNNFDRDMPALSQKAFTLAKYSKKVQLTDELIQDEDSRLMAFLEDFVGRGQAKTHNNLLLAEVAANGKLLKTFAAPAAIADGEIEDIEGDDDLGAYLDDSNSVGWVMRNSTLSAIRKISGSDRVYAVEAGGGPGVGASRTLIGYPVYRSNQAAAIATGNASVYFGNWYFVGKREAPSMTLLRDPYTVDGLVQLKYYFRTVYGVLQSEAIGRAEQA